MRKETKILMLVWLVLLLGGYASVSYYRQQQFEAQIEKNIVELEKTIEKNSMNLKKEWETLDKSDPVEISRYFRLELFSFYFTHFLDYNKHAQNLEKGLLRGTVTEEKKASWLLLLAEQKKRFARFYLGVIGVEKEVPTNGEALNLFNGKEYTESMKSSEKFIETTTSLLEEAKKEKIAGERVGRIPFFLLIVVAPPLVALFALRKKWVTKKNVHVALTFGIFYVILFNVIFLSSHTYSLSTINDDPDIGPFFDAIALFGVSLPLVIMAFVGGYLWKEGKYDLVKSSWMTSAAIAYFFLVQLGVHYLLQDNGISWYMPNMMLGFKYYVDAMQYIPMGYTSVLHPIVAVVVAVVVGKLFK